MGGTLLMISKNSRNSELFQSKAQDLYRFIDTEFKDHFSKILSHNLNKDGFLIEFRNNNDKKFHIDEDFKVITYGIKENTMSYEVKSIILTNMLNVEKLSLSKKEKINLLLDQI